MGFSRQEYWSRLPFHSPGDLPGPGIKPGSPIWEADSLPSEPPGKPELRSRMLLNILQYVQRHSEELSRDFPGGPVVKSVPANVGDMGSVPGQGRSHMLRGQPSPYARGTKACEPQSLVLWRREATSTRSLQTATREPPPLAAIRGSLRSQQRQGTTDQTVIQIQTSVVPKARSRDGALPSALEGWLLPGELLTN